MALFYTPHKKDKLRTPFKVQIQDLDYQGLGVAKHQGKTWFVQNALPGEELTVRVIEEKRQFGLAHPLSYHRTSTQRIMPACQYYEQCGGCQMQHMPLSLQQKAKQQAMLRNLKRLQPEITLFPLLQSDPWQYRRRTRLSLYWNAKSKKVILGFRQANSQLIVAVQHCPILEPELNQLLSPLQTLLEQWQQPSALGHIELVKADNGIALLLRHVKPLTLPDQQRLVQFAQQWHLMLFVHTGDSLQPLWGEQPYYQSIDGSLLHFDVGDFIQINRSINQQMVEQALHWLELSKQDKVLDLFCGMGNFTLPISRNVHTVIGVEGVATMVQKAKNNALQNHCHNAHFYQTNLEEDFSLQPWASISINKIILDPPRAGAAFALQALLSLAPQKILYVSCNPATLVRDAQLIILQGYHLVKANMLDMFPQTGHLESMVLFEKQQK